MKVVNYFRSYERLKITRPITFPAQARSTSLSLPLKVGRAPNHNKTRTHIMHMISEKALALLLAVAVSGTAFNTFIV